MHFDPRAGSNFTPMLKAALGLFQGASCVGFHLKGSMRANTARIRLLRLVYGSATAQHRVFG